MANRKLTRVHSLSQEIISRLKEHGILTCKDFLTHHSLELMGLLSLNYPQLQALSDTVSRAIAPKSQTALSMHKARQQAGSTSFLPTSLHKLDVALHGGLPPATITEVAGPPGCGKTQLCLMLSVIATLPSSVGGMGVQVAYVDTEAAFTAERLVEIAKARYPAHFSSVDNLMQLASSVHVFTELTCESFAQRLAHLDEVLAGQGVGLVVVDSIASLVRKEFDTRSGRGVAERTAVLAKQASRLKCLAEAFGIPIVVTNQITTHVLHDQATESDWSEETNGGFKELEDRRLVTAALGNTWSHCVNTRLLLQYMEGGKRMLTVAKSPLSSCESFVVGIEDKGLVLDWGATGELQQCRTWLESRGDPTTISLAVRSSTEEGPGLGGQLVGRYSSNSGQK